MLTCYNNKLHIRKPNTYPHTSSPPLQALTPVCNPSILHITITNISALNYYYYVLVLGFTTVASCMEKRLPSNL